MEHNKPLLSLCIPTYNRAKFLNELINKIGSQIQELENPELIEFIVSDNCSTDDTSDVVKRYIENGINIRYIRNERNLGMDGNFVSCFKKASGSYIWLLGDDDYLYPGVLNDILTILSNSNIGLLHLKALNNKNQIIEYNNSLSFLCDVSFWITYISSNIVNSKFVSYIDFEKYMGTYFTLIPLYMTAAKSIGYNIVYDKLWLDGGKDIKRNGGYNYYEVFIVNYLRIWSEMMKGYPNFSKLYRQEKYNIFKGHILPNTWEILIKNRKGNYKTNDGWKILFKYYGFLPKAWLITGYFISKKLGAKIFYLFK